MKPEYAMLGLLVVAAILLAGFAWGWFRWPFSVIPAVTEPGTGVVTEAKPIVFRGFKFRLHGELHFVPLDVMRYIEHDVESGTPTRYTVNAEHAYVGFPMVRPDYSNMPKAVLFGVDVRLLGEGKLELEVVFNRISVTEIEPVVAASETEMEWEAIKLFWFDKEAERLEQALAH